MIKISDYTSLDTQQIVSTSFKSIKYLYQTNSQQTLTFQSDEGKIYYVQCFENQKQAEILAELHKKQVFGNMIAVLKHKKLSKFDNNYKFKFICIFLPTISQTLQDYIEMNISQYKNTMLDEQYCHTFIQRMIEIFKQIQMQSILKVISPKHIIIRAKDIKISQKNNFSIFYLAYPLPHSLLSNDQTLAKNLKKYQYYCAPQVLSNIQKENLTNNFDFSRQFSKAVLYSLGLILLQCFNYKISLEDRYKALKNQRYLKLQIKSLRKQIKTFHQGKYVSKLIKLLLQGNEAIRDNTQTFDIKMHSYQFKTLKRKKNPNTSMQSNATTLCNQLQGVHASQRPVIDIRLTTLSNNQSSRVNKSNSSFSDSPSIQRPKQARLQQQIRSHNKLNQHMTTEFNSIVQDQKRQDSVVDIEVDWDDQSIRNSEKFKKSKPNSNQSQPKSNSNESGSKQNSNQNQKQANVQKEQQKLCQNNENSQKSNMSIQVQKDKQQKFIFQLSDKLQFSLNSQIFEDKEQANNNATNLSIKQKKSINSQNQVTASKQQDREKLFQTQICKRERDNINIVNVSQTGEIYTHQIRHPIELVKENSEEDQNSQLHEQSSGIILKGYTNNIKAKEKTLIINSDSQDSSDLQKQKQQKLNLKGNFTQNNQQKLEESFSNSQSQKNQHIKEKQIEICLREHDAEQQVYNYFQDQKNFDSPSRKNNLNKKESQQFFTLQEDFKQNVSLNTISKNNSIFMSHSSILKKDNFHRKSKAISLSLILILGMYTLMKLYIPDI